MNREDIKIVAKGLLSLALIACVFVGIWWVKREVNYYLLYDAAVVDSICEVVKAEYINEGYCGK